MVIEHVMEQHEPVDFASFLLGVGQDSADDWRTTYEVRRGTGKPLDLAAVRSAEETWIQSPTKTAWLKELSHRDPPRSWRYRDRVLQDWRAASMQSRQFRAMRKIAFFEMKTFLITAETAALLQRSMIKQLSHRDQKVATERMRSIAFPIGVEKIHVTCLPLPSRIKGFPSLSSVGIVTHGQKDNSYVRERAAICREAPCQFKDVMSQCGVPISRLKISIQIYRTAEVDRWEAMEEILSREVYPLLRTRARLLSLR